MIDAGLAQREIDTGLSAVCAWCERYYDGQREGKVSCGNINNGCGGPISGKGFPMYKGPMQNVLSSFCMICGGDTDGIVSVDGRVLGICTKKGPNGETCHDKLKRILARDKGIIVKERVVPVIGDKNEF